jgi:hypothetical protein
VSAARVSHIAPSRRGFVRTLLRRDWVPSDVVDSDGGAQDDAKRRRDCAHATRDDADVGSRLRLRAIVETARVDDIIVDAKRGNHRPRRPWKDNFVGPAHSLDV